MARRVETRLQMLGEHDYRMEHRPGGPEFGAQLHDLTALYPDDVYGPKAVRIYGQGGGPKSEYAGMDQEIYDLIAAARNNPDQMVKIYRSIPANAEPVINPGDWVTPSRRYAELHGTDVLGNPYGNQVVEMEVPARSLYTNGDSWAEWGYWPS